MRLCFLVQGVAAIIALLSLVGCNEKLSESPVKVVATNKAGKPGAGINIASASVLYVNPNEVLRTEIIFEVAKINSKIQVELTASEGVELLGSERIFMIEKATGDSPKIPLEIIAKTNGRFYVYFRCVQYDGETTSVRNLAVIIQSGNEPVKALQQEKPSGENLIVMPAEETISSH